MPDDAQHCPGCGVKFVVNPAAAPAYYADPSDHTAEYDEKDISDNKVIAMAAYILGVAGIIIALLASRDSAYAAFHVRQSLKIRITEAIVTLIGVVLFWTVIGPIVAGIAVLVLEIINLISFCSVCVGKAKEPAIIKSLNFLK